VADGEGWLAATELARDLDLPLHLVVHDGYGHWGGTHPVTGRLIESAFISAYQLAASRLCVSPRSEATYREKTGVSGTVLYPMRRPNARVYTTPPSRLEETLAEPVAMHIGTINSPSIVALLASLADVLSTLHGRLVLVGPRSHHVDRSTLLHRDNVEYRGFLPSMDAVTQLCRKQATFLYLPFSFENVGRTATSLPSKFVDYTAMGLPVLVQAPPRSSISDWICDNPGTVQFVDTRDPVILRRAILDISTNPQKARALAVALAAAGKRSFDHGAVTMVFHAALRRTQDLIKSD
jgi:hypothetical protein